MSTSNETPLYDEMLAEFDAAATEAESILARINQIEDQALALATCVEIVRAFETAERSFAEIRMRAERNGLKLFRQMRREAAP